MEENYFAALYMVGFLSAEARSQREYTYNFTVVFGQKGYIDYD